MHEKISFVAPVICLKDVSKRYNQKDTFVLRGIHLSVDIAEFVALIGPSGSGKSTLLHIAGLLDVQTDGTVSIRGRNVSSMSDDDKTVLRLSTIGFVYQYHYLLQEFSAIENVMLPLLIAGASAKVAREKAALLLEELGLQHKLSAFPSELSGGQRQRIAIARALANDPSLLLADEPTGNLDAETALQVFDDLTRVMEKTKMSAIIATHNLKLAERMHKRFLISDGRLLEQ
ncbi:MAG: ABC transporter ATP-binding protein [Holosporaceae bacterium]|jgi:lipoprotein-releasing system ATP-binding protein|nr:ABC transporter ATP-binding protein [Holosporaceae bacterium]